MPSSRAHVTLHGRDADALDDYVSEHGCTKAEAVRHYYQKGRESEERDSAPEQAVTDGGYQYNAQFDQWLEQITTFCGMGVVVAVSLLFWVNDAAGIDALVLFYAVIGLGAAGFREYRRKTQGVE